ncbi:hypothetical protein Tco_1175607 [Tanacetum coccineum]
MKNGAIKLCDENGNEFVVNKQRVKLYQKDTLDFDDSDVVNLEDEGGVTYGRVTPTFRWLLEEIHVTCAHLEKKWTDYDSNKLLEKIHSDGRGRRHQLIATGQKFGSRQHRIFLAVLEVAASKDTLEASSK